MNPYSKNFFCILFLLLVFQLTMQADHLYGGKMSYRMLDSAQGAFEVTLMLERPCSASPLNKEYAIHVLEYNSGTYQKNVYVAKLSDSNYISLPCFNAGSSCTSSNTQLIEHKFYKVNIIIQQSSKECLVFFKENTRCFAANISDPNVPLFLYVSFLPNFVNSKVSLNEVKRHLPIKNQLSTIEYQKKDLENDSIQVTSSAPLIGISYILNNPNLNYIMEKSIYTTGNSELKPFPISQSQLYIQPASISFTPTTAQSAWLSLIHNEYRKIKIGIKDTWIKISSSNTDRLLTVQDINSQFQLSSITSPNSNINILSQSITICNQPDSAEIHFKFPIEKNLNLSQLKIKFDTLPLTNFIINRSIASSIDTIIVTLKYLHTNYLDISSKLYFEFELCHSSSGIGFEKKTEVPMTIFNYKIFSADTIKNCSSSLTIPVQNHKLYSVNWGQIFTNPNSIFISSPRDTVLIATLSQSNAYCPFRDTIVIKHGSIFTTTIIGYLPTCKGVSDAAARVFVTGTNTPYSFLWSNFSTQDTIGSITSGTHIVTIKDKDGCSQQDTIVIADAEGVNANWIIDTPITCYNGTNGFGYFIITSVKKPYQYQWTHSPSVDSFLGNFSAGNFTGKFLYINSTGKNCLQNFTINFPKPDSIKLQIITTDNKCFGDSMGKIAVITQGGKSPFIYYFDSIVSINGLKTNLKNGSINVYVKDANNCATNSIYTSVKSPALIDYTLTKNVPSCQEVSNGSISINHGLGGTAPFSYSINNSSYTGQYLYTGLTAKNYTIKVKDDNECIVQKGISLYPLYVLTVNADSIVHSKCPSSNSGKIYLTISNGLSPFQVYKSQDLQTNYSRKVSYTFLSKGVHTIKVKDENQCIWTSNFTINEPDSFKISTTIKDESCYQYRNGQINLNSMTGGTSPYISSLWNDELSQPILRLDSLKPGKYIYNLLDKNRCSFTKEFLIQSKSIFKVKIDTIQPIKCFGNSNGHIRANILGGTQPLSYSWNNNSNLTQPEISTIPAGNYTLEVKDNDNCLAKTTAFLSNPDSIKLDLIQIKNQDCPQINNGAITINCSGGTSIKSPLKYALKPSTDFQIHNSFTNLSHGNYLVYVQDDNNCIDSFYTGLNKNKSIEIKLPDTIQCALGETISLQPNILFGDNTTNADIKSTGWIPQSNLSCIDCIQTEYTATQSGLYSLNLNYGNGCAAIANIYFNVAKPEEIFIPNSFTPNNDAKNDLWFVYGKNIKAIDIKLFNKVGEMLFYTTDIMKGWDGTYNGKSESINTYRYIINAKYIDGTLKKYDGVLNLIR
jgi:gliding motility-associated-like protein